MKDENINEYIARTALFLEKENCNRRKRISEFKEKKNDKVIIQKNKPNLPRVNNAGFHRKIALNRLNLKHSTSNKKLAYIICKNTNLTYKNSHKGILRNIRLYSQGIIDSKPNKSTATDFYRTKEWRELRYKALIKYGRKCMCCGATPETGSVMHVDHIKPRSKYPELKLNLNNLQILCEDCNMGKLNHSSEDFRIEKTEYELDEDSLKHMQSIKVEM